MARVTEHSRNLLPLAALGLNTAHATSLTSQTFTYPGQQLRIRHLNTANPSTISVTCGSSNGTAIVSSDDSKIKVGGSADVTLTAMR